MSCHSDIGSFFTFHHADKSFDPTLMEVRRPTAAAGVAVPTTIAPQQKYRYSEKERDKLEELYLRSQYPTRNQVEQVADQLGITYKQIRVWLQNRRARARKQAALSAGMSSLASVAAARRDGNEFGSEYSSQSSPRSSSVMSPVSLSSPSSLSSSSFSFPSPSSWSSSSSPSSWSSSPSPSSWSSSPSPSTFASSAVDPCSQSVHCCPPPVADYPASRSGSPTKMLAPLYSYDHHVPSAYVRVSHPHAAPQAGGAKVQPNATDLYCVVPSSIVGQHMHQPHHFAPVLTSSMPSAPSTAVATPFPSSSSSSSSATSAPTPSVAAAAFVPPSPPPPLSSSFSVRPPPPLNSPQDPQTTSATSASSASASLSNSENLHRKACVTYISAFQDAYDGDYLYDVLNDAGPATQHGGDNWCWPGRSSATNLDLDSVQAVGDRPGTLATVPTPSNLSPDERAPPQPSAGLNCSILAKATSRKQEVCPNSGSAEKESQNEESCSLPTDSFECGDPEFNVGRRGSNSSVVSLILSLEADLIGEILPPLEEDAQN